MDRHRRLLRRIQFHQGRLSRYRFRSVLLIMIGTVLVPLMIGGFNPAIIDAIWMVCRRPLYCLMPLMFMGFVADMSGFVRPGGRLMALTPERARLPMLTIGLIAAHGIVFGASAAIDIEGLSSLAAESFGGLDLVLVTVTRTFVHTDFEHFYINMTYLLWCGTLLELRLGAGRYLAAILLGSVTVSLINLNLLLARVTFSDAASHIYQHAFAGFSGAIAALLGLLILCLHHPPPSMPRPEPYGGRFFLSNLICLSAIGLFFTRDFRQGIITVGPVGTIDYWGHLAGFLGGLMLAFIFTIQDAESGQASEGPADQSGGVAAKEGIVHRAPEGRSGTWIICPGGLVCGRGSSSRQVPVLKCNDNLF